MPLWRLPLARVTLALKDCKVLRENPGSLVTQAYLVHQDFLAQPVILVILAHLANLAHLAKPAHLENPVMRAQMVLTEHRA